MLPSNQNQTPHHASFSFTTTNSPFQLAFKVLDVDCDGKISHHDLHMSYGSVVGQHHHDTNKGDIIDSMMVVADTNGDGFVEYEEFKTPIPVQTADKSSNVKILGFGTIIITHDNGLGLEYSKCCTLYRLDESDADL